MSLPISDLVIAFKLNLIPVFLGLGAKERCNFSKSSNALRSCLFQRFNAADTDSMELCGDLDVGNTRDLYGSLKNLIQNCNES